MTGEKQLIIAELWEVYRYYFFFLSLQNKYILHILQATHIQPVSRLQLLLFTANFIGSSYMSEFFHKNDTYIELSMGSVAGVVCFFLLRV